MAFDGRVVRTYGRLRQKTIKRDHWISPNPLAGRKISNVFSSPDNDSNVSSDASAINTSEKENLVPADINEDKKPRRKAAKKASAVLEEYALNNEGKIDSSKGQKTRQNKTGKDRQFSKLSRQYKKLCGKDKEEILKEEEEDSDVHQIAKGKSRMLRGKAAPKPSDLSFDLIYNIAKQKKTTKSSSSSDSVVSPMLSDETVEGLELEDAVVETSTPYEERQRSLGQSLDNRGCITRRAKRGAAFSPGGHGRRRIKRQRVIVPPILSFSEDDSFLVAPRRLRTRQRDIVSDVASRLSAIHLEESSPLCDDSHGDDEESRTHKCSVRLSRLSHSSIEELGHGSMDLFEDQDQDLEQDQDHGLDIENKTRLRSCHVPVHRLSLSSGIISDATDEHESLCQSKDNHRPFLRQRTDATSDEFNARTPLVNKSIGRLAIDSFKVALTPTKSKKTGKLLSPKCKVLGQCDQEDFITFSACLPSAMMKKCVKIGEGVYGEVFRTANSRKSAVAIKIIPVEGDFPVNEESQKPFEEILPEIVISRELSMLREGEDTMTTNFIEVNGVSCVQGSYPKKLLDEWDKYDSRKTSENDRPDIFPSDQLFIIFEFADGGRDLESFEFENIHQAVSVIQQVTGALAVAEQELDFEHRDLHWGNVLVGGTKDDQVTFKLDGQVIAVDSQGLHISIIDFTLSRLQKDDCTVFCDLAEDPTLFTGEGDKQFDVYRLMKEHNNNQWESFQPKTNVFWIEYLLDKIIWEKKYPTDRSQRKVLGQLKTLVREIQQYSSAEDVFRNSELLSIG